MNREELRQYCEREITEYAHGNHKATAGNPWPKEKVQEQLRECKAALVEPYKINIELRDTMEQIKSSPPVICEVWVVADDRRGYKIIYNPKTREFGLAQYTVGDNYDIPLSINVNGDLVGTFMAR